MRIRAELLEKLTLVGSTQVEAVRGDGERVITLAGFTNSRGVKVRQQLLCVGKQETVKCSRIATEINRKT